jgi:hypothetical protein
MVRAAVRTDTDELRDSAARLAVQAGRAIAACQVAAKLRNSGTSPAQHITVHIVGADQL